jgi:multiple sugar transport system substrate-binding protein
MSINMEYVGFQGNSGQRLQTLFQSGDQPELFQGTLPEMGLIVGDGRGVPANEVNDDIREFYDDDIRLINTAKLGGSAEWLVPHGWQTISTFTYRSDIYDQLSLEVPETWDELLNNAEAIDNDGDIEARGFGLAAQKTGKSASVFDGFFRSNGGYYYEEVDGEVEVWFPEDVAIETLEFLQQLGQYSPDPSQLSWGPTIKFWLSNRIAQVDFASAWLADVAFDSDLPDLATSTQLAELPLPSTDADPLDRGLVVIDGTPLIEGSNVEGAKHWLSWLYADDTERTAKMNLMNLRILPSTDAVFESDTYQNSEELARGDGFMTEQQQKVRQIAENKSHPDRPSSIATSYVERFPILEEMMNAVIVANTSPSDAVAEARDRFETRLQEGKDRVAELPDDYNEYDG